MTSTFRALTHGAVAVAALGIAFGACAQSSQSSLAREIGESRPQAGKSFIDLSVGKSTYGTSCGNVAGLTCSRGTTSYSLTGRQHGHRERRRRAVRDEPRQGRPRRRQRHRARPQPERRRPPAAGRQLRDRRQGRPDLRRDARQRARRSSGLPSGRARGFGLGYGVALDVNVARGLHGSVGWEQHDFKFVGQGRSNVKNVTLALGYTF